MFSFVVFVYSCATISRLSVKVQTFKLEVVMFFQIGFIRFGSFFHNVLFLN